MTTALRPLRLAALLLAVSALEARVHAAPMPSATIEIAPARLTVAQTHGYVSRPTEPNGYTLFVRGAPGARFEVYTTATGGARVLVGSGSIPPGGSITMAVMTSGKPNSSPSEKVLVSSRATARVQVVLVYS